MQKILIIVVVMLAACVGCQWNLRPSDDDDAASVGIERYDQIERIYLTTGDFAALQQLKTIYPIQTRTLIEDVLGIGQVSDSDINMRFLVFFQDTTLQTILADVETQYADMTDVSRELNRAFFRLRQLLPEMSLPNVYTQVGSLDQSIVVGDGLLGISLDKYLGEDYPLYLKYDYTSQQRSMMTRQYIVPDCIGFFLLSRYPLPFDSTDEAHQWHMAKIQYVVNRVTGREVFTHPLISRVDSMVKGQKAFSVDKLLRSATSCSFAPSMER